MKVSKKDVRSLIFEGGGGKGLIYLGVAKALEELGILEYIEKNIGDITVKRLNPQKIHGVAGTSAGSLMATLIAAGYTPSEMYDVLSTDYGMQLLDKVDYGRVPTAYTTTNPRYIIDNDDIPEDKELFENYWKNYIRSEKFSMKRILKLPGKALTQIGRKFITSVLKWYLDFQFRKNDNGDSENNVNSDQNSSTEEAFDKILETTESLNSIQYDLGLFLCEFSREFVDKLIENKSGIRNCTFKQFYDEFKIDLVITGFDINTKETLYFRKDKWGDLCIADAVRMSGSIPFVFKPVHLCFDESGKICSVDDDLSNGHLIVDGGLGNNFPLHAFDKISSHTSKLNEQVLGFRFEKEITQTNKNLTMGRYVSTIFSALLGQTTELQIRCLEERDQVIDLEHEEIGVMEFAFTELTKKYYDKAYTKTMNYFK